MARHTRFPNTPPGQNTHAASSRSPASASYSQSLDSVTTEAILGKLSKAKEIESQLEAIAAEQKAASKRSGGGGNKSDTKPQALRLQLCELLSDVILNDSTLSESNDAIGRLWKHCFYGRIFDIRSRITKEKGRAKKRQATDAGAAETAKKLVRDLEGQLNQFLKEAIQLYKYVIERYVKDLMPLSQSQSSPLSEMSQLQAEEDERERSLVVIASLYRMHIHLGDLFRYSNAHKHAEECYLKACKLAPGTGNPFNQLAVVAQGQQQGGSGGDAPTATPTTAIALYYYARSLMADRGAFETSRSNLVRLFEGNRKWLEEHCRDGTDNGARGLFNVGNTGYSRGDKRAQKAQKEMMSRERTAMNRKALARMVDLQWDFFRGVSLDDDDDTVAGNKKTNIDSLETKMTNLLESFTNLISQTSFSESLLNKLVCILAFSALGASTDGRLLTMDGMNHKRRKDPSWDSEGEIMTNQALAFSFLLKVCAVLARDADEMIAKSGDSESKNSGGRNNNNNNNNNNKLGSIRTLSPFLLGLRFATSVYEGCEWFHGLAFFPGSIGSDDAGSSSRGLEGNFIYKLCKESHVDFWKSVATVTNHFDKLPGRKKGRKGVSESDIVNVKDFAEFQGYVPFTSFLDKSRSRVSSKKIKYATADEVLVALSDPRQSGGGKGGMEVETNLKINVILSIAGNKTLDNNGSAKKDDGVFFLTRDSDTNERVFLEDVASAEEEEEEEEEDEEELSEKDETQSPRIESSYDASVSPMKSPNVAEDIMHVETPAKEGEKVDDDNAQEIPFKLSYSGQGMALLTPAALLAGAGAADKPKSPQPVNVAANSGGSVLAFDSMLSPAADIVKTPSAGSLLNLANFSNQHPQQAPAPVAKAALPPPPGFSMPSQPPQHQTAPLAPSTSGISLAQFTTVPPQARQGGAGSMMPQAGLPSYPGATPNMFETMNPFAQVPAPPQSNFNNGFMGTSSSSSGLMNIMAQGVNLQQHQQQRSNNGGLDPTLDFLLRSSGVQPNNNNNNHMPASLSNSALDLLMTPAAASEPEDPSESILNFLFNDVAGSSSQGGMRKPLYAANRGHHAPPQHGVPPTNNPFAT